MSMIVIVLMVAVTVVVVVLMHATGKMAGPMMAVLDNHLLQAHISLIINDLQSDHQATPRIQVPHRDCRLHTDRVVILAVVVEVP